MILWWRNIFRSTNKFGYENMTCTIMLMSSVFVWHLTDKYFGMRIVMEGLINLKC